MGVITELARRAPTMMIPSATSPLLFFYEMSFARGVFMYAQVPYSEPMAERRA